MLMPFRMKAIMGLVGLCFWIAAACLPTCAAADTSATTDQSEVASVGDAQPRYQERGTTAELRDNCGLRTPEDKFSLDVPAMSTTAPPCQQPLLTLGNKPEEEAKVQPSIERFPASKPADFNRDIYYRNKLEFSLDGGWHPINIPFPLDIFVGDAYNTYPLKYTLVPIFASLRWHMGGLWGPGILRGNFDLTFTGSVTAIPRGPETRYFSYIMGIRRNFVPRNRRIAPYFDVRLGVGHIDAKGPQGVKYAQGQDVTFTINMGSGVRYNFNPRYAISAGMNFMHISNLDLSESNGKPNWGVRNYGINVYGPMVGIDIQLRRHPRHSE
jgi:Lipid A 3-O-deacylase (PagL)